MARSSKNVRGSGILSSARRGRRAATGGAAARRRRLFPAPRWPTTGLRPVKTGIGPVKTGLRPVRGATVRGRAGRRFGPAGTGGRGTVRCMCFPETGAGPDKSPKSGPFPLFPPLYSLYLFHEYRMRLGQVMEKQGFSLPRRSPFTIFVSRIQDAARTSHGKARLSLASPLAFHYICTLYNTGGGSDEKAKQVFLYSSLAFRYICLINH